MKRNRKIFFKKIHKYIGGHLGEYIAVTDGYIVKQVSKICEKYNIEIKSIKIEDNLFSNDDYIIIKANKENFNKFCIDFCKTLSDYIENIRF